MIDELRKRTTVSAILLIGLFTFIFLGAEYLYVNMIALTAEARKAVNAQNYALGVSVAGFLLYPALSRLVKRQYQGIITLALALAAIVCIFVMQQHLSYAAILISGMVLFFVLGFFGSAVHSIAARIVRASAALARIVGIAYALGILLQFLNNNLVNVETAEAGFLSAFLAMLCVLMLWTQQRYLKHVKETEPESSGQNEEAAMSRKKLSAGLLLALLVALMACVFSTLDNAVTLPHASGHADVGQWPRILLAVSGLMAGFLFDIRKRKFMNLIMYCVMMLSTLCVAVIWLGDPFLIGLVVFYLTAGFFAVYFTTSFMELSLHMRFPALWAGLGRAVNNLSAVLVTNGSVTLLFAGGGIITILLVLLLFAAVMVVMAAYAAQMREITRMNDAQRREADKFSKFTQVFSLTPREKEVFQQLLAEPNENLQVISEQLAISRTALYKHIRSLNDKTQTGTRLDLTQFYYQWGERNTIKGSIGQPFKTETENL